MADIMQNSGATLDFDRSDFAVVWEESLEATLMWALCRFKQKTFFPRIPLVSTVKQCSLHSGFFSSTVAASDAIDKAPTWASCTGYIGLSLPLIACRANLVEVSHNLCSQSGILSAMRIELTRHAHLVWKQMEKEAKSLSLCPFDESMEIATI